MITNKNYKFSMERISYILEYNQLSSCIPDYVIEESHLLNL